MSHASAKKFPLPFLLYATSTLLTKKMLPSGYTSTRIIFTVISFSPQMKLTQLPSFFVTPQELYLQTQSSHLPALLEPFSFLSVPLTLLFAALPTSHLTQLHKPRVHLGFTLFHLWWHLTHSGCLAIPTLLFAALTSFSCYNLSWQHIQTQCFAAQFLPLFSDSLFHVCTISNPAADSQQFLHHLPSLTETCFFCCQCQ